jgi:hypothetical protein
VRGDLQDNSGGNIYAAILAARSFRTMMAKAALEDLECEQFDVTNAFLNSTIDKASGRIYVRLPEGMADLGLLEPGKHTGMVAELDKALYGLKNAPLLWFKEFTKTLRDIGLQ